MKKAINMILCIIMILSVFPTVIIAEDASVGFKGVSDWAKAEVQEAKVKNLIPEEMLNDDLTENITRAEFAGIAMQLYQAISKEQLSWHGGYIIDIEDNIYEMYILGAYNLGITSGTGEKDGGVIFSPDLNITREQLATMLCRVVKLNKFENWFPGNDSDFPLDISNTKKFGDDYQISDYANESVYYMSKHGIIKGVDSTHFAPLETATKEQAILLALRTFNTYDKLSSTPSEGGSESEVENKIDLVDEVNVFAEKDAEKINKSIQSLHSNEEKIVMVIKSGTEFDDLKNGEVFFLEGEEGTPFGEPFFGKVSHISDNGNYLSVNIEEPALDEVFEVLSFDMEDTMEKEEIKEMVLADGLELVDSVDLSDNLVSGSQESAELMSSGVSVQGNERKIALSGTIDLLELVELKDKKKVDSKIYWLPNSEKYHLSTCRYVKYKMPQTQSCKPSDTEKYLGLRPCEVCSPDKKSKEEKLEIDVKLELDNINLTPVFEFNASEGGIKEFELNGSADLKFETMLNATIGGKIQKKATSMNIAGECIKLKGLEEKKFPIAYFSWSPGVTAQWGMMDKGFSKFEKTALKCPVTFAVIAYVDMDGEISLNSSVGFSYEKSFNFSVTAIENYKTNLKADAGATEGVWEVPVVANIKGDLTVEEAVSFMIYVFNVNIAEFAMIKFQQNATGEAELKLQYGSEGAVPPEFTVDGHADFRLIVGQLKVAVKMSGKALDVLDFGFGRNFTWILYEKVIAEFGEKPDTYYNKDTMGVDFCTAYDDEYYYYKGKDNCLIKKSKDSTFRQVLLKTEFHSICAIDDNYLYLLVNNDETYKLVRIQKDNGYERLLVSDVKEVFFQDETNIYYVDDFSKNSIMKLNRDELTTQEFVGFEHDVVGVYPYEYMDGEKYYVITYEPDMFASLFGESCNNCYVISKNGKILEDFDKASGIEEYRLTRFNYYYAAVAHAKDDIWDEEWATEVLWVSDDMDDKISIDTIDGWNIQEEGIFAVEKNPDKGSPYILYVYRARKGDKVKVDYVNSAQVRRTLHSKKVVDYDLNKKMHEKKVWYFIDEISEGKLGLYEMDYNYEDISKVKNIETSYEIGECKICSIDDTLFIYSSEDGQNTQLVDIIEVG